MTPNNQNILTDIFRMAEAHDVTIAFAYSKDFRCFRLGVWKGDLCTKQYINPRDFRNTAFIFNLIGDMIRVVEKGDESKQKRKERKDD